MPVGTTTPQLPTPWPGAGGPRFAMCRSGPLGCSSTCPARPCPPRTLPKASLGMPEHPIPLRRDCPALPASPSFPCCTSGPGQYKNPPFRNKHAAVPSTPAPTLTLPASLAPPRPRGCWNNARPTPPTPGPVRLALFACATSLHLGRGLSRLSTGRQSWITRPGHGALSGSVYAATIFYSIFSAQPPAPRHPLYGQLWRDALGQLQQAPPWSLLLEVLQRLQHLRRQEGRDVSEFEESMRPSLHVAARQLPNSRSVHLQWILPFCTNPSGHVPASAQETLLEAYMGPRDAAEHLRRATHLQPDSPAPESSPSSSSDTDGHYTAGDPPSPVAQPRAASGQCPR
jgi:hypothetical protein